MYREIENLNLNGNIYQKLENMNNLFENHEFEKKRKKVYQGKKYF